VPPRRVRLAPSAPAPRPLTLTCRVLHHDYSPPTALHTDWPSPTALSLRPVAPLNSTTTFLISFLLLAVLPSARLSAHSTWSTTTLASGAIVGGGKEYDAMPSGVGASRLAASDAAEMPGEAVKSGEPV